MANDTHGASGTGWYGFDLDGTLAKYDKWEGIDHIGEPIAPMVELIKQMHDEGKIVKILTARVSPRPTVETAPTPYPLYAGEDIGDVPMYAAQWMNSMRDAGHVVDQVEACKFYLKANWTARDFVADWCLKNLGFLPDITHEKDHLMLELYDDRVKQIIPNEGILIETLASDYYREIRRLTDRIVVLEFYEEDRKMRRFTLHLALVMLGFLLATVVSLVTEVCTRPEGDLQTAVQELREATYKFQRVSEAPAALKALGLEGSAK